MSSLPIANAKSAMVSIVMFLVPFSFFVTDPLSISRMRAISARVSPLFACSSARASRIACWIFPRNLANTRRRFGTCSLEDIMVHDSRYSLGRVQVERITEINNRFDERGIVFEFLHILLQGSANEDDHSLPTEPTEKADIRGLEFP